MNKVKEFHEAFNILISDKPHISDQDLNNLRVDLLQEELNELKEALDDNDTVEVLDALVDLQYVLDGAFLSLGYWKVKDRAIDEVHRSNMTKLDNKGKPVYREDGKVIKGPNYEAPNLSKLVS